MKRYSKDDIEALTNWDRLLCKSPWHNDVQKRQYYSRFISRMLWGAFTAEDWRAVTPIINDLRISEKLKRATRFLAKRHTQNK
ncbi:MAG: hypothetical protein Q8P56_05450 [Candidatus Uhrbacteria bacterium]|nr:hypothetical protein [Candidatus Uhrbacteria bacterium]